MASLQEIRRTLVGKQVELSDMQDGPLYLVIEAMVLGIRQFLTFEELLKQGDHTPPHPPFCDFRRQPDVRQAYFDALEILRGHLSRCLVQIAAIGAIKASGDGLVANYQGPWQIEAYVTPNMSDERKPVGEECNLNLYSVLPSVSPSASGRRVYDRIQLLLSLARKAVPQWTPNVETRKGWNSYPVRMVGPRESSCHGKPTLLVRSMQGGFVTANCAECGKPDTLAESEFLDLGLWVSCPSCKKRLEAVMIEKNYGHRCSNCKCELRLSDLLPSWEDLL